MANPDQLLRTLAPQILGTLLRRYGDFGRAEDAVQEALLAASVQWTRDGLPDNPRGWLIQAASRRLLDQVRADTARRRREEQSVREEPDDAQVVPSPEDAVEERDDTLLLLFMSCHPSLTAASAIALTLRAVGGLTTAEVARAFLVPEPTMAQRISRAKETIKASGAGFVMPSPEERAGRLGAVLHVLYLIFNEGYAASSGEALQRTHLANEAIRLTRTVHGLLPDEPEIAGLLALMLLTDARRLARTGPDAGLIPLDEQDRSRWDRAEIAEGVALLEKTLRLGRPGPYQLQAAIAALHDEAASVEATDWRQILALYDGLRQLADNPVVELNRAIAVAMIEGPARALELLERLEHDKRLAAGHRLDAVRAHLLEKAGDLPKAIDCYRRAASRTTSTPERDYLMRRIARLAEKTPAGQGVTNP